MWTPTHELLGRYIFLFFFKTISSNLKILTLKTLKASYNKFALLDINGKLRKASEDYKKNHNTETHFKDIEKDEKARRLILEDTEIHIEHLSKQRNLQLPASFDARKRWPECASVHRIVNQGDCGSCWVMASTSVISDRVCIHSNATLQPQISTQDLLDCCPNWGGCFGSLWLMYSFTFWKTRGIVTGIFCCWLKGFFRG